MGFFERRADQHRLPSRTDDRYGRKHNPLTGGANGPAYQPAAVRRANADPVDLPPVPAAPPAAAPAAPPASPDSPAGAAPEASSRSAAVRTDLSLLLGGTMSDAQVRRVCAEYGLVPPGGGPGPSRSYLARDAGVELTADEYGMVTTVFLHFHGDDGFTPYTGEIPGGAGSVPSRSALRESLGRPGESGEPYCDRFLGDYGPWDRWDRTTFHLHAQYAADGEAVTRVTLTLPFRPGA